MITTFGLTGGVAADAVATPAPKPGTAIATTMRQAARAAVMVVRKGWISGLA